mgnify:CR=1 FL=1
MTNPERQCIISLSVKWFIDGESDSEIQVTSRDLAVAADLVTALLRPQITLRDTEREETVRAITESMRGRS